MPTVGYGEVVGKKGEPLPNITRTKPEALQFVRQKIQSLSFQLMSRFHNAWNKCNQARQAILISLAYQLGVAGVSAFRNMWAALERGDFELASKHMLDSKWAKQTPNRAKRQAQVMKDGALTQYYLTNGELP